MLNSFTIVFNKNNDINNLVHQTEEYFHLQIEKVGQNHYSGVDLTHDFIVNLGQNKIEFILSNKEYLSTLKDKISSFIRHNFLNKSVGIYTEDPSFVNYLENIQHVNIIKMD